MKLVQNNLSACLTGRYQLIIDPDTIHTVSFSDLFDLVREEKKI